MTGVVVVHGISGTCSPAWRAYFDSLEIIEENPSISTSPFDLVYAVTVGDMVDAVSGMPR